MKYLYSSKNDAFYPLDLKDMYEEAGSWPDDGIEVADDVFNQFTGEPPKNQHRGGDADGLPSWIANPPPSHEDEVAVAEQQKSSLLSEAQQTISIWQSELQLGIISDEDKASLTAWISFIKAVKAVDTSNAPDIAWPIEPST